MTDPLDALRLPLVPVAPDPSFATGLRARIERALGTSDRTGADMANETVTAAAEELAWGPALAPYIAVADARRALGWYIEVFAARPRGEPYVMPDGSIGHAELGIGDAVLMLAEDYPAEGVVAPEPGGGASVTLHVQVPDVDATLGRAVELGAELSRPVSDQPYGRTGVIRDPFGHRWMVLTPPPSATRARHGDVAYVTLAMPDDELAKDFYGAVLGWRFSPGSVERGWQAEGPLPMAGVGGGQERPEVQLCYRVGDLDAAVARVRDLGGTAGEPALQSYGRLAECVDNQGLRFQLWAPPD